MTALKVTDGIQPKSIRYESNATDDVLRELFRYEGQHHKLTIKLGCSSVRRIPFIASDDCTKVWTCKDNLDDQQRFLWNATRIDLLHTDIIHDSLIVKIPATLDRITMTFKQTDSSRTEPSIVFELDPTITSYESIQENLIPLILSAVGQPISRMVNVINQGIFSVTYNAILSVLNDYSSMYASNVAEAWFLTITGTPCMEIRNRSGGKVYTFICDEVPSQPAIGVWNYVIDHATSRYTIILSEISAGSGEEGSLRITLLSSYDISEDNPPHISFVYSPPTAALKTLHARADAVLQRLALGL